MKIEIKSRIKRLLNFRSECILRNIKLTIEYDGKDFNRLAKATK